MVALVRYSVMYDLLGVTGVETVRSDIEARTYPKRLCQTSWLARLVAKIISIFT